MARIKARYIETPVKNNIKEAGNQDTLNILNRLDSGYLVWYLIKRHKFGLVTSWAVVITALWSMPFLPDLLFGLVGR